MFYDALRGSMHRTLKAKTVLKSLNSELADETEKLHQQQLNNKAREAISQQQLNNNS